jgi:hypothetical protein
MLTLVGTGYGVAGHVTPETRSVIEGADKLFYLVTDPTTAAWLRELHPAAESLHDSYREGANGMESSHEMAARIVAPLDEGLTVCAAFTGHPAIALHAGHEALRRARAGGPRARMLPAVSFEDCLVADVGVDPGATGRALYEATDFLVRPRPVDTGAALVLIQVGAIGVRDYRPGREPDRSGLALLQEALLRHYPPGHEVVIYETPQIPLADPIIVRLPVGELADGPARVASTLYVPPLAERPKDPEIVRRLAERRSPSS